jgi:hypothetical protein
MESKIFPSGMSSLEIQLQSSSERFDYVLENNVNFDEAKRIYKEIKELRLRLKEINPETS